MKFDFHHIPLLLLICLSMAAFQDAAAQQSSSTLKLRTVVLDPGHGGKDAGCVSRDRKTYEKNLTLSIARLLGQKITQSTSKAAYTCCTDYSHLVGKPSYERMSELADRLMDDYLSGRTDKVCTVYNHFHSMGHQAPVMEQILPFQDVSIADKGRETATDYILEPGPDELLEILLPYEVRTRLYRTLLDSITAENAARTIAMQTATDNAQELIDELSLEYNKKRQQAITEELADITQGNS